MNDIDKIFTKGIDGYEETPPKEVWSNLEALLEKQAAERYRRKYRRLLWLTIFCILLAAGSLLYYGPSYYSDNRPAATPPYSISGDPSFPGTHPTDTRSTAKTVVPPLNRREKQVKTGADYVLNRRGNNSTGDNKMISGKNKAAGRKEKQASPDKTVPPVLRTKTAAIDDDIVYERTLIEKNTFYKDGAVGKTVRIPKAVSDINGSLEHASLLPVSHDITSHRGNPRRFSLSVFVSPDITGVHLRQNYLYDNRDIEDYMDDEQNGFSYTLGIMGGYNFFKKWTFRSGITLSHNFISIDPLIISAKPNDAGLYKFRFASSYGVVEIPNAFVTDPQANDSIRLTGFSTQQTSYLGIPMQLSYLLLSGKFDVTASVGFSVNFFTEGEVEMFVPKNSTSVKEIAHDIEGLKSSYFEGSVGVGASYHLNKRLSIDLHPTWRFSITSINENTPVRSYPHNIGFESGLTYKF